MTNLAWKLFPELESATMLMYINLEWIQIDDDGATSELFAANFLLITSYQGRVYQNGIMPELLRTTSGLFGNLPHLESKSHLNINSMENKNVSTYPKV